jgi:RNA polymerase sigma-70 factor (ECF subfamily)
MADAHPAVSAASFHTTRWSQVLAASGESDAARAALEWLCRAYWEPLRRHAHRRGWRDADDCVQEFWLHLLARGSLIKADRERGRFRSWLLASLDHHLHDTWERAAALKRGGGQHLRPLTDDEAVPGAEVDPGIAFDRAWAETLLQRARARLANEQQDAAGRARFAALERFLDVNAGIDEYHQVGIALGLGESAVKVAVHRLRQRFKAALRQEVAETLAEPGEAAIDAELGDLLAALTATTGRDGHTGISGNRGSGIP